MANERLIVELDAKSQKLEAALKRTDAGLDKVEKGARKTSGSLSLMSAAGSKAAAGVRAAGNAASVAAKSIAAMGAALGATAAASASYAKDLEITSTLTKTSIEETQALAFATSTVGINMENLGNISKDTSEKIGDFINTGGGGFMDFVDAMGMTQEEALKVAKSFQGMAGTDILKEMVKQMEDAGVGAEQMSNALEGMASDTTKLIPLLADGASKMGQLKKEFTDTSVVLTSTDVEKLKEMGNNFSSVYSTFKATLGKISVEYNEEINAMLEDTQAGLKLIGDEFASGAFTQRYNAFLEAYSKSWSVALGDTVEIFDEISINWSELANSMSRIWLDFGLTLPITLKKGGMQAVEFFNDIVDEIMIKIGEANVLMQQGLENLGFNADVAGAESTLEKWKEEIAARDQKAEAEIQALEREKQAIIEKFVLEQELATQKREEYEADTQNRIDLANKEYENEKALEEKRLKDRKKLTEGEKKAAKDKRKTAKDEQKTEQDNANKSIQLANMVFGENKAISATTAFINTAEGVTKALSEQNYAGAALTAATGAIQISSILSAEKGSGGSVSAPASAPQASQQDFQPETTGLDVTEQVEGGGVQTLRVVIEDSDGNSYLDAISNLSQEKMARN